jgi:hypothetical protein
MRQFATVASLLIAVSLTGAAVGQIAPASKTPTIDQSLEMFSVGAPKISPDGKHVIYEQARTNWESNAFETDLWLANVATGERHLLTVGLPLRPILRRLSFRSAAAMLSRLEMADLICAGDGEHDTGERCRSQAIGELGDRGLSGGRRFG